MSGLASGATEQASATTEQASSTTEQASATTEQASSTTSTMQDKRKVDDDDCFYEVESTMEGEDGLHTNRIRCNKNPGHIKFIPLQEFSRQHLPSRYQDIDIMDLVKTLAGLTVRMTVSKISPNRPPPPYPPVSRDKQSSIYGSGFVWRVSLHTEMDKYREPCPCASCRNASTPEPRWGQIYVKTVVHVVYDDIEAAETLCHFHYDAADTDLAKLPKVSGREVAYSEVKNDMCSMIFLTHDLALVEHLDKLVHQCMDFEEKICAKYKVNSDNVPDVEHNLTLIVSHPHGCSKCVTVGETKGKRKISGKNYNTQYLYTSETCKGSSGAPVYILGKCWLTEAPHSGTQKSTGLGRSAIWF